MWIIVIDFVVCFSCVVLAGMFIKRRFEKREDTTKAYYIRKGWEACENWMIETGVEARTMIAIRKKREGR